MKEYGSNIQKLVDNMVNIEDREKRTRYAHILVELMRQIHPNMKDGQDYYNKLWDDLYIMSGFTLDVDSPYPPPSPEVLGRKPQRVPYNTHPLKFKHFGYNMGLLINKAAAIDDADEKRAFVSYLFRLMKTFYSTWNKEAVEDETIFQSLLEMSNGQLGDDIALIRQHGLVEGTPRERTGDAPQRMGHGPRESGPREGGHRDAGHRDAGHRSFNQGGPREGGPREGGPSGYPNSYGHNRNNQRGRDMGGQRDNGGRQGHRNDNQRPREGGPREGGPRGGNNFRPNPRNDNNQNRRRR